MRHFLLSAFHLKAAAILKSIESSSNINSRKQNFIKIILHTEDDVLRQLATKREKFALFLIDATRYMSLAGTTLME